MAITAILDLQLKPEAVETASEVIHETLTATRAFPGCFHVAVLVDSNDPAHVVLYETWESVEHDSAYRAWRATPEGASGSARSWPPRPNSPGSPSPKASS